MKKRVKSILSRWLVLFLCLTIISGLVFFRTKPFVFTFAKSRASTIMINAADSAILNILKKDNITYDSIAVISRDAEDNFMGIEIDTIALNRLKSSISNEISRIISENQHYDLDIPIGTLIGSEYTTGIGPRITFHMRVSETAVMNFKSSFVSAGINQTMHQILLTVNINANILMMGATEGFSVSTTAVAAQTVITGKVPESFTNVIEQPGNDIADEIFNYADFANVR